MGGENRGGASLVRHAPHQELRVRAPLLPRVAVHRARGHRELRLRETTTIEAQSTGSFARPRLPLRIREHVRCGQRPVEQRAQRRGHFARRNVRHCDTFQRRCLRSSGTAARFQRSTALTVSQLDTTRNVSKVSMSVQKRRPSTDQPTAPAARWPHVQRGRGVLVYSCVWKDTVSVQQILLNQ